MQGNRFPGTTRPACAAAMLALLGSLLLTGQAAAQLINGNLLPCPRLTSVMPPGGKAGTTVEVAFTGTDLEEPEALLFSHPGLKAVPIIPPPPPAVKPNPKKPAPAMKAPAKQVVTKFAVTISPDVPLGAHDVRLVNKWGISNPRVFVVGNLNEVLEKEPNNDIEQAQRVEVGTTINGVIAAPTDVDYYVFAGKKGQRVVISCLGASIDSRINPELKLYDSVSLGKQVAYNRPPPGQDALVDLLVPADGDYYVRLCQFTYTQGTAEFFYRLTLSTQPWIDAVFPPLVEPNKATQVTLYGRNLPGSKPVAGDMSGRNLEELTVSVTATPASPDALQRLEYTGHVPPASTGLDGFEYRLRTPAGPSNPVLLTFAQAPVVLDNGANATAETAQAVPLPCEIAGRIAKRRERHWYTFTAKKGDIYMIETLSHRLGAPTDLHFTLRNATNPKQVTEITQQDDDLVSLGINQLYTPSRDPAPFRFVVPADGKYELLLGSHVSDTQFGPEHGYRLRIAPERPDFRLVVMPPDSIRPDTCIIGQGGNEHVTVYAWRHDGFKGDIALSVEGLPMGVTCKPQVLTLGLKHALLVFSAAPNTAPFSGPIKVKGTAVVDGKPVVREARPATITWPVQAQQGIPTIARMDRALMLAVRGKAPLNLSAGVDKVTVMHGDKLTIPLKLTRLWPELKGQFQVAGVPQDLPQGMNFGALTFAPGKDEQKVVMNVPANVAPGTYSLVFRGFVAIPFNKDPMAKQKPNVNVVQPSTPVQVTILPKQVAQLTVSNANPTIKLGKEAEILVRVNRLYDYTDAFKVKLVLPKGVQGLSADDVIISAGQNEAKLLVRVPANATPGNRANLIVQAVAVVNGNVPLTHETKINVNVVK